MSKFAYHHGELHAESIALKEIAARVRTPFYCYSRRGILENLAHYQQAFMGCDHLIAYALKANSNQAVLTLLSKEGAGADVVSGGELRRALAAGIPADKIVFSGVGKTADEIDLALAHDILCFNVESEPELEMIARRARIHGKKAPVSLRVNPDVDAKTHKKIATGQYENKFGIPLDRALECYKRARDLDEIDLVGIDAHIGSQICELAPFRQAFIILSDFIKVLAQSGITLKHVDIGGGLGINYGEPKEKLPTPNEYGKLARQFFEPFNLKIICEPGRSLTLTVLVHYRSVRSI